MNIDSLQNIIEVLSQNHTHHSCNSDFYHNVSKNIKRIINSHFLTDNGSSAFMLPFGDINFPYFSFGNKSSLDLFDIDELIIFSYYWINRHRYKNVADIGANIGLHSLILSKCGYNVFSYEPDPIHFQQLNYVVKLNNLINVNPLKAAISNKSGVCMFSRVLGNTTSSHLEGSKIPYGEIIQFPVDVISIHDVINSVDLIKMDVEGHESEILLSTSSCDWTATDAIVEIGSKSNAKKIYEHFRNLGVHLFSQKTSWSIVNSIHDMPESYKEGSLFISKCRSMNWG